MIILLGFCKCGTSSFQYLFEKLGYESYHYRFKKKKFLGDLILKNKNNNNNLLECIATEENKNNICLTQIDVCINEKLNYWPQIVDYERLYEENKDAIFILNIRDTDKLMNSMKKCFLTTKINNLSLFDRIFKFNPELFNDIEGDNNDEKFKNLVEKHHKNIIEFFKEKEAKFILYNIEEDNLEKLGKIIDLKGFKEFPYKNKTCDNKKTVFLHNKNSLNYLKMFN